MKKQRFIIVSLLAVFLFFQQNTAHTQQFNGNPHKDLAGQNFRNTAVQLAQATTSTTSSASALPVYWAEKSRSFADAVHAIGTNEAILALAHKQLIWKSLIIPANIHLRFKEGGYLDIQAGATVTIQSPIETGLYQVFKCCKTGLVQFAAGTVKEVYPQWWGARGNGKTEDTDAVQNAINAIAKAGGGNVFFAKGTYPVNSLVLDSNVNIVGQGWDSLLIQKSGAVYCISVNPGSGGTPNPVDNKHDITIRDIQLRGTVEKDGFAEHFHLLNLNAATNIFITNCKFVGWRGDGIYMGSSNTPKTERHNLNISISGCVFDGLNRNNRNAVSVIDGNNVAIENSSFVNCSRSDMPGAIDFEPNNAYNILKNLKISGNKFEKVGGHVNISLYISAGIQKLDQGLENIQIVNNIIIAENNRIGIYINQPVWNTTPSNDISIIGNTIKNTNNPIVIRGLQSNVLVQDNITDQIKTILPIRL